MIRLYRVHSPHHTTPHHTTPHHTTPHHTTPQRSEATPASLGGATPPVPLGGATPLKRTSLPHVETASRPSPPPKVQA